MNLRFMGDWNPWVGGAVALVLAGLAWWLYRRETRTNLTRLRWLLPVVRVAVVVLAVLMLTGPVLHHRKVVGERGRVLVFVDASQSMKLTDEPMEVSRKLLTARRLGWLPPEALDTQLADSADALARARRAAGGENGDPARWRESARAFAQEAEEAFRLLSGVKADIGGIALERKGVILREYWTGVPGTTVAELTRHPNFPSKPDGVSNPESFEAPVNWGDNYGTRMRGFIHPNATGSYTFWISGDDQCELWLSSDADPSHRQLVAKVPNFSGSRQWDVTPEQKSAPIRLEAGKKYYIEALHKEGSGEDSVSVGWQLPDGKMERPIPGARLSSPATSAESPARAMETLVGRFREELLAPAQTLASKPRDGDPGKSLLALQGLLTTASNWERELRDAFANYAARVAAPSDPAIVAAVQKFDALPRWKRVEAMLTSGAKTLLERLSEKHHVELLALNGKTAQPLWSSGSETSEATVQAPRSLALDPSAPTTNLADGLRNRITDKEAERIAAVLISDGQHNEGGSPLAAAKMLGNRQIPVYTVCVGSTALPDDLAILNVKTPQSVFYKDRVKGEVVLKDDMPPGRPFTVKIECGGQLVWEKRLSTEQTHLRSVPFDFPVQTLIEKVAAGREKGIEVLNQPLTFHASVSAVDGEKEKSNNEADFSMHAIMQRRKVLILDGRPRWEVRYLRNLFDRDDQWEVNALIADRGNEGWTRGKNLGQFPGDKETLFSYDLIVFGEVPRQFLTKLEEQEWIRDFVAKRGGGLLVIDGRRGHISNFVGTPLEALFPVDWKAAETGRPTGMKLTDAGARKAWLQISTEAEKNAESWSSLQPPHWVAPVRALPTSEVLVEALMGERKVPALVYRRFGAGKVLYSGFDESWRWRYEVADLYHQRYWNQMVREIMEPPFTVRDSRVSLNVGKLVYGPDESVDIRARLRDADGRPVVTTGAEALIYKDGKKVATVKLAGDENAAGLFQGQVAALAGGSYEVRVRAEGTAEPDGALKTEFKVQPREAGELAVLNANEDLLRQVAAQSGGEFFREEEARELASRLEPLSRERVFESDTALWQSWWWFAPMVALLTVEWILRKYTGML
ncbi:MAG TPA: PA14 domain-containing protein [Planctomycetota bacterium]|nr:PA14 domain-containing protein [Planctomycetota bacterium]